MNFESLDKQELIKIIKKQNDEINDLKKAIILCNFHQLNDSSKLDLFNQLTNPNNSNQNNDEEKNRENKEISIDEKKTKETERGNHIKSAPINPNLSTQDSIKTQLARASPIEEIKQPSKKNKEENEKVRKIEVEKEKKTEKKEEKTSKKSTPKEKEEAEMEIEKPLLLQFENQHNIQFKMEKMVKRFNHLLAQKIPLEKIHLLTFSLYQSERLKQLISSGNDKIDLSRLNISTLPQLAFEILNNQVVLNYTAPILQIKNAIKHAITLYKQHHKTSGNFEEILGISFDELMVYFRKISLKSFDTEHDNFYLILKYFYNYLNGWKYFDQKKILINALKLLKEDKKLLEEWSDNYFIVAEFQLLNREEYNLISFLMQSNQRFTLFSQASYVFYNVDVYNKNISSFQESFSSNINQIDCTPEEISKKSKIIYFLFFFFHLIFLFFFFHHCFFFDFNFFYFFFKKALHLLQHFQCGIMT